MYHTKQTFENVNVSVFLALFLVQFVYQSVQGHIWTVACGYHTKQAIENVKSERVFSGVCVSISSGAHLDCACGCHTKQAIGNVKSKRVLMACVRVSGQGHNVSSFC